MKLKMLGLIVCVISITGCAASAPQLGLTNGQLTPCPITPSCVNSQATAEFNFIQPLYFAGTQQQAKERLVKVLGATERTRVIENKDNYIRAESRSAVFRFIDDVEFYFPPNESGTIMIQTRSASRLGLSDLGVNRRRIERIRVKFNAN